MIRLMMVGLCTLVLTSCRGNANNVVLSSLDRSAKLQFLCADLDLITGNLFDLRQILPTGLCTQETIFAPEVEAQFMSAVTQTQTGEVAVVSYTTSAILDTNRTIPGVTALRVGEQPTGIQISPDEPSYTYVSSFSPKSVQAIPTEAVITGESLFPGQQVRFDAGPTDLALYERASFERITDSEDRVTGAKSTVEYRYLYAAIPELGKIAEIEVGIIKDDVNGDRHGILGTPKLLDLPDADCASVTQVTSPASTPDDYHRICPEDLPDLDVPGRFIKTVNTNETCVDGAVPGARPVALAIDPGLVGGDGIGLLDEYLLVADANQPVIHRFKLTRDGAEFEDTIVTGTPTLDVDVTPFVPATSDPSDLAATQRYLYAVSATDSSVLAVDYTKDTPDFGAVLPIIAGITARANEENVESRNRSRFGFANVRSIEVVSPFYELEVDADSATVAADALCSPTDGDAFAQAQNESNLRGVFLAVSLSNGRMVFHDIYDLNAPCRGGEGTIACTVAESGPDRFASIRRHRRRIGFTPTTFISIDGTPSLQFNAAPGKLDDTTGDPLNSDGPGLELITCPPSMLNVFGDDGALICTSSQVWSNPTQRWEARWGGLIPHSQGGLGLFSDSSFGGEPGSWFRGGDVPLCRVGVLGQQQGPDVEGDLSIELLASYGGDRLVITGELPPSTRDDPRCEGFTELEEDIDERQVWFPIVRAFDDELEIGPSERGAAADADVRFCFNQFTEYQIHTQDVYTVTGTTTGFIHRVVPDASNECVFDDERPVDLNDVDTFLTARAFEGTQFINPLVSFEIRPFDRPTVTPTDSTIALLNFAIMNQFTPDSLDTSTARRSLPASMLFSEQQDQLFFVDFEAGVRRIVFSPLSIVQTFE
jgi:hypothetical protein